MTRNSVGGRRQFRDSGAVLTAEQLAEFERTGIVKLEAAFTDAEAAGMREVAWNEMRHRHGIERENRATWPASLVHGMKSAKKSRAFAPMIGPALTGALDQLLGEWKPPKHFGQVLITMPQPGPWRVPHKLWHADFGYPHSTDELFAVKYWALFGDVVPGGGGTPQLAGSHALTARYIAGRADDDLEYKRIRDTFLRSHPWLKALSTEDTDPRRNERFMAEEADIDGLPARVVELTGRAGDIFITHPWVMHSIAPNVADQPRLMRSGAIYRAGLADADDDDR